MYYLVASRQTRNKLRILIMIEAKLRQNSIEIALKIEIIDISVDFNYRISTVFIFLMTIDI